jgi:hypothetical protein
MRKAVYNKPCGGLGTKRWAATMLFSRALSVWNDLFVGGLVEGDARRACLKMFYRHRNLEQVAPSSIDFPVLFLIAYTTHESPRGGAR